MKKLMPIIFSFFFAKAVLSQNNGCGSDILQAVQKSNLKNYDSIFKWTNITIKNFIKDNYENTQLKSASSSPTNYIIPVVVHVVYPSGQAYGTGVNISYAQIKSQIDAMNAAFGKYYPTYNGQNHPSYAQNTKVKFCLARIAAPSTVNFYSGPQGTEYGVMRYADNVLTNHQITNASATALMGLTHPNSTYFPFANYLNIWVVSSINGAIGYAPLPIMGSYPLDGVVIRSDVFGDNTTNNNFNLGFGLQQGKVMTHELGHYFNLYHIFQGGCTGTNASGASSDACDLNGDYVCDTEPCTTQNIVCNIGVPNTCSANYAVGTTTLDMIESYMSYADDDCMNTFTMGQTQRIWANLNTNRKSLWQYGNLGATGVMSASGCVAPTLFSDIKVNYQSNCTNSLITISNPTAGNTATSWTWTCPGANITSANTSSIAISYSVAGQHKVKLKVKSGTTILTDSVFIYVSSCTIDPLKRNRANWLFGDYCSINFSTGVPVVNNLAISHNTQKCTDVAVSMSDSLGNLLFYSNGKDLWDNTHTLVNSSPLFGWDLTPWANGYGGTSVTGFMSFPVPKQANKYYLICAPPFEVKNNSQIYMYGNISYVIYDAVTKTVSPYQSLTSPLLNYNWIQSNWGMTENLNVVPHCNGVDYWVIARGLNTQGQMYFYSFLVNQAGLNPTATPVLSGPYPAANYGYSSNLKSNSTGDKMVCMGLAQNDAFIYDFNSTTGQLSNPVQLASAITGTNLYNMGCGVIFSPNDQYIYKPSAIGLEQISVANNTVVKVFNYSSSTGFLWLSSEVGPDNNIYFDGQFNGTNVLMQLTNPNSAVSSTLNSFVTFTSIPGCDPNLSNLNFMEALKPTEVNPLVMQQLSCTSFSFALDPCWQIYSATWNFGDGSPPATGTAFSHTYANTGIYTVSLTLAYSGQNIPVITKTVQVFNPNNITITGPTLVCNGGTYFNSYATNPLSGVSYTWSGINLSIAGAINLSNATAVGGAAGNATIQLQAGNSVCNGVASKTVLVVNLPQVSLNVNPDTLCLNQPAVITGSPAGGIFGNVFNPNAYSSSSAGFKIVSYSYTDSFGCTKTISKTVLIENCNQMDEDFSETIKVYPNPTKDYIHVISNIRYQHYEIVSTLGQLIYSANFENEINVQQLESGLYFLKIFTGTDNTYVLKFIKEK